VSQFVQFYVHYNFLRDIDSFSVKTDAVLKTYRLFMEIDT
jgi:hypothetical protein